MLLSHFFSLTKSSCIGYFQRNNILYRYKPYFISKCQSIKINNAAYQYVNNLPYTYLEHWNSECIAYTVWHRILYSYKCELNKFLTFDIIIFVHITVSFSYNQPDTWHDTSSSIFFILSFKLWESQFIHHTFR